MYFRGRDAATPRDLSTNAIFKLSRLKQLLLFSSTKKQYCFSFQSDLLTCEYEVTNVQLVIYKVNMCSKNILLKLNLISCHGNKRKKAEITGDLNGSNSD